MGNRADSFDRANGALQSSTPSDGGSVWLGGSSFTVTSNRAAGSGGNSWVPSALEASTAEVDVSATLFTVGNGGLVLRYADVNNFLLIQAQSTGLGVYRRVAGSFTQEGTLYSGTISAGNVIRATIDGSNVLNVYQGATLRIGPITVTAGSANTKHGIVAYTTPTWDDFSLTDTASAGTPVGLASETDTALGLSGVHIRAAGLATEADTALALSARQIAAVGLATETDTALARTATLIRPAGLATETDTALALAPGAAPGAVGLAVETDQALPLTGRQIRAVGLAVETDTALALSPGSGALVGMALEIDAAFALQAVQRRPVGLAVESDTALALLPLGATPADSLARFTISAQARRLSIAATARRLEIGR